MKDESSNQSLEYRNFVSLTGKVLSVPREELNARMEDYRAASLQNTNRRGPKKRTKTSSSPDSNVA
jgi:hypothetical protein